MDLNQLILSRKATLAESVAGPLGRLAETCAGVFADRTALDQALASALPGLPNCHLLYAWNVTGTVVSAMVRRDGMDPSWLGRNLSDRPYLKNHLPFQGVMLSSVYLSKYSYEDSITALQAVRREDELLGFIAADFAVRDLLRDTADTPPDTTWRQFKGDPAVRGQVFSQTRETSLLDPRLDEVLDRIDTLMRVHGVFHCQIHFSSGRAIFWMYDDPYSYRLHGPDELLNPELMLAYPARPWPKKPKVRPEDVLKVFERFKQLRLGDETIYLRVASLNVMNGLVGLTFSCDGSHYLSVDEFLGRGIDFWLGSGSVSAATAG